MGARKGRSRGRRASGGMSVRARPPQPAQRDAPTAALAPREPRLAQVLRVGLELGGRRGLDGKPAPVPATGTCAPEKMRGPRPEPQPWSIDVNMLRLPSVGPITSWRSGATKQERTTAAEKLEDEGPEVRIWEALQPYLEVPGYPVVEPSAPDSLAKGVVYLLDAANLFHACWRPNGSNGWDFYGFQRTKEVQDILAEYRQNVVPIAMLQSFKAPPKGPAGAVVLVMNGESYRDHFQYCMGALVVATSALHEWQYPIIIVEARIRRCTDKKVKSPDKQDEINDYDCVEYMPDDPRYNDVSRKPPPGERSCRIKYPELEAGYAWWTKNTGHRHSLCELDDLLLLRLQRRYLWIMASGGQRTTTSRWEQPAYAGVMCTTDELLIKESKDPAYDEKFKKDGDDFARLDTALEFQLHVITSMELARLEPELKRPLRWVLDSGT